MRALRVCLVLLVPFQLFVAARAPCPTPAETGHRAVAGRVGTALVVSIAAASAQVVRLPGSQTTSLSADIEEIVAGLGRISGLKPLRKIQYERIAKDRVKQFLEERIEQVVKPEELRAEELFLKKFGFVPQEFDLVKSSVALLAEQAAAFYDFRKKKLFLIDQVPSDLERTVLVHELAHALADQHFNLAKFVRRAGDDDDGSLARVAVMEGQATWLMSEYMSRREGIRPARPTVEAAAGLYPVFEGAPLYLRETLLFPYTEGRLFQQSVFQKMGPAAVAEVFRSPPASSQQILHSEKYFARAGPARPALPDLSTHRAYRQLIEGGVGELDHRILLEQYIGRSESEKVSPLWRGGRYRLLERKGENSVVLAYSSEWENPAAAREFFRLYRQVLERKWKTIQIEAELEDRVAGRGDDGCFLLRRAGSLVTSLEGMRSPADAKLDRVR